MPEMLTTRGQAGAQPSLTAIQAQASYHSPSSSGRSSRALDMSLGPGVRSPDADLQTQGEHRMTSPFSHPDAPGGGEKGPRPRDMVGALVAYSPRLFTAAGAPGNTTGVGNSQPRDRVTADLYILQSPTDILYGGSPEYDQDPKPHTHLVRGPARFMGLWISNSNIVKALAPNNQPLTGQMVLGRIVRSEIGQRPFNLQSVDGTPDLNLAIDIWSRLQMGALQYTEPMALNPRAVPPAGSVSYASPQAPAPQYAPPAAAQPAYPATAAPPAYAPPTAAPAYAPPAAPAPQPGSYEAWLASQQQAAAPQPAAAPAIPMPPGWTDAAWASLTPEQKQQVWAAAR